MPEIKPNAEQSNALIELNKNQNVFLTGAAGTGKSFVIKEYLKTCSEKPPVLASTGAAAVLAGGCTFHSFFGLGIMKDGLEKTIERAARNSRVRKRIENTSEIIIDEVSMIDPEAFYAADQICKVLLNYEKPFGGIKVIAVGDFFQLPPVYKSKRPFWLFNTKIWNALNFKTIELKQIMRTNDEDFMHMLSNVRTGNCGQDTSDFFESRTLDDISDFEGTVLFGRKLNVESFNQKKLNAISGKTKVYKTDVIIPKKSKITKEKALSLSPLPEELHLKKEALVMIRKNHAYNLYVNGTLGHILEMKDDLIKIKKLNGRVIELERTSFEILDADNKVQAEISNFPLSLAWASTIHKAQGASIDRVFVDLSGLWENGQAYVALSRAKSLDGLFLKNWSPKYIKSSEQVQAFYNSF